MTLPTPKPGDVQVVLNIHPSRVQELAAWLRNEASDRPCLAYTLSKQIAVQGHGHRLAVIDPTLVEHVSRLRRLLPDGHITIDQLQAALAEFATPTPDEPTDPKACVTDRRDNIWRLLADGDWVCVCGPDHGEYIAWSRLAAERGPLTVEVPA